MKPMQEISAHLVFCLLFHDDCLNTFRSMRSKYNKKTALQITLVSEALSNASTSIIDTQYAQF